MMPKLALRKLDLETIDWWACTVRICRDLTCWNCGYYEMGQTIGSPIGVELLYCRNCLHGIKVQ